MSCFNGKSRSHCDCEGKAAEERGQMHDVFVKNAGLRSGNMSRMKEKLEENRFKAMVGNVSLLILQLEVGGDY
jgi:hypothetical protein